MSSDIIFSITLFVCDDILCIVYWYKCIFYWHNADSVAEPKSSKWNKMKLISYMNHRNCFVVFVVCSSVLTRQTIISITSLWHRLNYVTSPQTASWHKIMAEISQSPERDVHSCLCKLQWKAYVGYEHYPTVGYYLWWGFAHSVIHSMAATR